MLARLANMSVKSALRGWEVHFETACDAVSIPTDIDSLVVHLHALRSLVLQLPDHALEHLAGECGRTIAPVYNSMQKTIKSDFEHVVQVLSDLERFAEDKDLNVLDEATHMCPISTYPMNLGTVLSEETLSQLQQRNCARGFLCSSNPQAGVNFQTMIPRIIITPCEPQEQDSSTCHVPLQNSAFGGQLTVPSHPVFNHTFPPLASTPHPSLTLQNWTWQFGHWQATLPSIHEQETTGLFSKALTKRRKLRPRRSRS